MSDQQLPNSSRVTLEDLFRIKRAERPRAEFWMEFERSLRAKQLAAIVEKRPWWSSRRSYYSITKWSIPLGAAAALTLAFATIGPAYHQSRVVTKTAHIDPAPAPVAREVIHPVVTVAVDKTPELAPPASSQLSSTAPSTVSSREPQKVDAPPAAAIASVDAVAHGRLASVTEQIAGIGLDADVDSEKTAATRFASVVKKDFRDDVNAYFEHAVASLDSGIRSERSASVEPLSQVPTPRDARRARLLAFTSSVDTHSPQYSDSSNVIRSRDRIASHLSEEALFDSIRRLGIKNGGVSIQF